MDAYGRRKIVAGICVIVLFLILLIGEAMRDQTLRRWAYAWLCVVLGGMGAVIVLLVLLFGYGAAARDLGQWENTDPIIHEWYQHLERPDAPGSICCTEADAYWADETHVRDGKTYATITDDRDDAPLRRPHIPNGTEFEIPPEKLKWDKGNPTGHNVLFVNTSGFTWCFVMGSGT